MKRCSIEVSKLDRGSEKRQGIMKKCTVHGIHTRREKQYYSMLCEIEIDFMVNFLSMSSSFMSNVL